MSEQHAGTPGAVARCEIAPGVLVPASSLRFSFGPSRGPGGQNVNRRSTRAELRVAVGELGLSPAAETRLRVLARGRITGEGELLITCEEERSQRRNRDTCLERLGELVQRALVPPRPRRATKPSTSAKRRRLESKRRRSEQKQRRRRVDD